MSWNYYGFRPYVSVAQRRANAKREVAKLAKKGKTISPVVLQGRTIASSFWGKAWCDNLESYMDFANRLPRGRTYIRNGSVVHLEIKPGAVEALVSGSALYKININISPAPKAKWNTLRHECAGSIGSLVELLQGRLSDRVMDIITRPATGLFPNPTEIKMKCSCPDWATMCKHIAAVLYGVGARLDHQPELLFVLRSVNHEELITQAAAATELTSKATTAGPELAESDLSAVFGIELDTQPIPTPTPTPTPSASTPAPKTKPKTKLSNSPDPTPPAFLKDKTAAKPRKSIADSPSSPPKRRPMRRRDAKERWG